MQFSPVIEQTYPISPSILPFSSGVLSCIQDKLAARHGQPIHCEVLGMVLGKYAKKHEGVAS